VQLEVKMSAETLFFCVREHGTRTRTRYRPILSLLPLPVLESTGLPQVLPKTARVGDGGFLAWVASPGRRGGLICC
jgi:hypothetical protein